MVDGATPSTFESDSVASGNGHARRGDREEGGQGFRRVDRDGGFQIVGVWEREEAARFRTRWEDAALEAAQTVSRTVGCGRQPPMPMCQPIV